MNAAAVQSGGKLLPRASPLLRIATAALSLHRSCCLLSTAAVQP
jgi:hypothetical protein